MKDFKKILTLMLAVLMLLSVCACKKAPVEGDQNTEPEIVIPSIIYGTWYPHPEVDDIAVVIGEDGTFTRDGKKLSWTVDTITEEKVILIAIDGEEEYTLTFSQLNFPVPMLSVTNYGVFIQQENLWKYMVEWYCPDNGNAFSLSFFELAQNGCKISVNGDDMKVEVLNAGKTTYTIELSGDQAIVTDSEGNSTTYERLN